MDMLSGTLTNDERIFRIYTTVIEMLNDRGYDVQQQLDELQAYSELSTNDDSTPSENFVEDKGIQRVLEDAATSNSLINQLTLTITDFKPDVPYELKPIKVIFSNQEKFNLKEFYEMMKKDELNHFIIIYFKKWNLTKITVKSLYTLRKRGSKIELFPHDSLVYNITRHDFVPKQTIISEKQKQELLSHYNISPLQLPYIFDTDPISKYLGAEEGQVIKIERKVATSGRYTVYRYVIHNEND